MSAAAPSYVLGCHAGEHARLQRQHAIWRDAMLAAWDRACFGPGQRLLDLGCGPGFASLELAERVGPSGLVLAIDSSEAFINHLEQLGQVGHLPQLRSQLCDLADPDAAPWAPGCWDGAWCRWTAMFLPRLEPLLDRLGEALRPGARLVMHEYVRWDTFALHPRGDSLSLFVQRCTTHWRNHGGDADVAQLLPPLLEARGFRLLHSTSLMACSPTNHPKALWLQDFLSSYPAQLAAAGCWSRAEQEALEAELDWARQHTSLWVTPAVVELVWERQ